MRLFTGENILWLLLFIVDLQIIGILGIDEFIDVEYRSGEVDKFKIHGSSFEESVCKTKFNARLERKWSDGVECMCAAGETFIALNGEVPKCQVEDINNRIFDCSCSGQCSQILKQYRSSDRVIGKIYLGDLDCLNQYQSGKEGLYSWNGKRLIPRLTFAEDFTLALQTTSILNIMWKDNRPFDVYNKYEGVLAKYNLTLTCGGKTIERCLIWKGEGKQESIRINYEIITPPTTQPTIPPNTLFTKPTATTVTQSQSTTFATKTTTTIQSTITSTENPITTTASTTRARSTTPLKSSTTVHQPTTAAKTTTKTPPTTANPEPTTNSTTSKPMMTTRSISGSDTTTQDSSTTTIFIGSLVGVLVLLIIVIVLVIVCCIKKRRGEVNKNKAPIQFHADNPAFKASAPSQQQHSNGEYLYPEFGPASNVHQNQQSRTTGYEFDPEDEGNSQYQPYLKPDTLVYEPIPYND
uniref:Uncharacterized protein n=1 Tax=Clytia hemisphaerica TaxID=252671 RepID=A0A7M5XCB3_9CNID